MQSLDVVQGTKEWLELRDEYRTASNAPVIMGDSKYTKRDEFLRSKIYGDEKEISPFMQSIFDKGHQAEEDARPIIEGLINEELYRTTGVEGRYLASFDGLTMMSDMVFEHKLWNESLAASVNNNTLHDHYKWQMDQQMLVSGADRCIFVVSDGTRENMVTLFYMRDEKRIEKLKAGWEQFEDDVKNYESKEPNKEVISITDNASLPALVVRISGGVRETNLDVYKDKAFAYINNINTDLVSDNHFSQAEADIKFCKSAEDKITLVKEQALAQTASIETIFNTLDDISEYMRKTRLSLGKLVKTEKAKRNQIIIDDAIVAMREAHKEASDEFHGKVSFSSQDFGFHESVKGLRTITSKQSAIDDQVARLKVDLTIGRDRVRKSLDKINQHKDHSFLLQDIQELAFMTEEILDLTIRGRIEKYEEKQEELKVREENRLEELRLREKQGNAKNQLFEDNVSEEHEETVEVEQNETSGDTEDKYKIKTDPLGDLILLKGYLADLRRIQPPELHLHSEEDELCREVILIIWNYLSDVEEQITNHKNSM